MREKILEHANILFSQYGIRSVTMDDLAKEISISKRTIYLHFNDKNSLIREVVMKEYSSKRQQISDSINAMDNVIEAIVEIIKVSTIHKKAVNPLYFKDLKKYNPDIFNGISDNQKRLNIGLNGQFVKKGIEQGLFRPDLHVEIVISFIQKIASHIHHCVIEEGMNIQDIIQDGLFAYLIGISTPKGQEIIDEQRKLLSEIYNNHITQ